MSDRRPHPALRVLLVFAAAAILGACAGGRDGPVDEGILGPRSDTLEAPLRAVGGTVARGTVRVAQTAKDTTVSIYFYNVNAGRYRLALHSTGNCTSPNGFSAGAPWVPPGAAAPIVIEFSVDEGGGGSLTQRVPGLTLIGPQGVSGRSVVIHQGTSSALDALPDVANDRVACGAFAPVLRYF